MDGKRPRYIDYALMASGVDPLDEELYLDTFRRRWGSLDQDALTRAVSEGNGEDKLFAIFGLGYQPSSTAHALLFEALESAPLRERWAITLCLGNAGERRCLPMLNAMLTDHLPTRLEDFLAEGITEYDDARGDVPAILAKLGDTRATPYLLDALTRVIGLLRQSILFLEAESLSPHDLPIHRNELAPDVRKRIDEALAGRAHRYIAANDHPKRGEGNVVHIVTSGAHEAELQWLMQYLDDVIFALGSLGALGAFAGIEVPELYMRIWMVHLVMGSMHKQLEISDLKAVARGKTSEQILVAMIAPSLQQYFGLFEHEQTRAIAFYSMTKLHRLVGMLELAKREERE